jgi:hypothetical protein
MEYLNEEMDDLFRKAGEHYPLKTSDSDWDAVLGRLQPQAGNEFQDTQDSGDKKKKRNRKLFWLLLLLPLGLFSVRYFGGSAEKSKTLPVAARPPAASQKNSASSDIRDTRTDLSSVSAGTNLNPEEKTEGSANVVPQDKNSPDRKTLHSGQLPAKENLSLESYSANRKDKSDWQHAGRSRQQTETAGNHSVINDKTSVNQGKENHKGTENEQSGIADMPSELKKPFKTESQKPAEAIPDQGKSEASKSLATAAPAISTQDTTQKTTGPDNKKDQAKKSRTKEKGIYLSLVGGPDLSTVRFQSVKKTGFSIGVLAGYRFSKHISAETGVLWDRKQYYSEGKYFNKSKTSIPPNVRITDLSGTCDMFEIPIHFRYDFSFTRKGRFFSTAGFSTYIMKKENYDYSAEAYGTSWSRNVSYPNSGNNIFSILQLSGGYEYQLGKIGRIRIEPYLKIPLSGVGIGSLPISSAGLYLGITHPFR